MSDPKVDTTPPVMSQTDLLSLVVKADKDHYKKDLGYEFGNGRKFEDTGSPES